MNKTWKVSKYLISDMRNGIIIFYGVILCIAVFMISTALKVGTAADSHVSVGGLSSASVVFLFIVGLNCFRTNFRFMQANNVSRKRFFKANIITLLVVAAIMAVLDVLINNIMARIIPYQGLYEQLYKNNFFAADLIWSFSMLALSAFLGWFITMLYYKCNKLMKIIVSFSPLIFFILLGYVNNLTEGASVKGIVSFFTMFFSMSNLNPYIAAFNIMIAAAVVIGLCYLLIYRAPVKD